jgi:hypothetical protein
LLLVACCYYKDARVHCEVLNIRAVSRASGLETLELRSAVKPAADSNRNFRTQQRACRLPHLHRCSTPTRVGCTDDSRSSSRLTGQCSTFQSSRRQDSRLANRDGRARLVNCSLERRRATVSSPPRFSRTLLHRLQQQNGLEIPPYGGPNHHD